MDQPRQKLLLLLWETEAAFVFFNFIGQMCHGEEPVKLVIELENVCMVFFLQVSNADEPFQLLILVFDNDFFFWVKNA